MVMTHEEFWSHFLNSCRNGNTLKQELTRITTEPVKYHPDDWLNYTTVEQLGIDLGVADRKIRDWIGEGKLKAKKVGRSFYITRASIKELLAYDESKLEAVPWEALDSPPRGFVESLGRTVAWKERFAEARSLAVRMQPKE